jgi:hypothetical protein
MVMNTRNNAHCGHQALVRTLLKKEWTVRQPGVFKKAGQPFTSLSEQPMATDCTMLGLHARCCGLTAGSGGQGR